MFKGLQHNPALTNIKFTTSVTQMKAAKQQENMAHNQGKKNSIEIDLEMTEMVKSGL